MSGRTAPQPGTVAEHRRIREAEESGAPFVQYRDRDGGLSTAALSPSTPSNLIGRSDSADIVLGWDERVSRAHARLELIGGEWTIDDSGLSRNGTFVNGARIVGRHRLGDGDTLQMGRTTLVFRHPGDDDERTLVERDPIREITLTMSQTRVARSLCRAALTSEPLAIPPSSRTIAVEIHMSVDAVKAHLRELYRKFGIDALPPVQKRSRLVRLLIDAGHVSRSDLSDQTGSGSPPPGA